jgi:hypothetical protein
MPRWSAERRAGLRYWPAICGDPQIGPAARRAKGCGVPHRRLSALRPPQGAKDKRGEARAPAKKINPPGGEALAAIDKQADASAYPHSIFDNAKAKDQTNTWEATKSRERNP